MNLFGLIKNYFSLCARYLAVIYLGIQLMGCNALIKHYVSVPDENIPGASLTGSSVIGNDIIAFSWPDLDLNIQVQNHIDGGFGVIGLVIVPIIPFWGKGGEVPEGSDLLLWIDLVPKDNTFSFDPGRVTLKFDDGTIVKVKIFIGPAEPWHSPRTVAEGCGKRRFGVGVAKSRIVIGDNDLKRPNGLIAIPFEKKSFWNPGKGHSCFLLVFDTNSSPNRTFVLSIEGIDKSRTQYPVPEIRYRKGSIWKSFPLP